MNHIPDDREHIFLWPGEAPHTKESEGQAQPSIKPFRIEGSKGAVVVCPGGGYVMKAAHEGDPIAEMLNRAGLYAVIEHIRGYARAVEHFRDGVALVRGLHYIPAARAHDYRAL
jgi:hypothetical protein